MLFVLFKSFRVRKETSCKMLFYLHVSNLAWTLCLTRTDWASAKQVLGDTNFLKKLQEYDKDRIPDSTMKKLKEYIDHPEFVPDLVATQSKVCRSMCMWVRAIDSYYVTFRIVDPKRRK